MKAKTKVETLISEMNKTLSIITKIENYYDKFKKDEFEQLGKTISSAIIISEIFVNYYTCLETLFLKISQYFENNLSDSKWHKDLLDKMTLDIPDVREAVLSATSFQLLLEFLRFRHFKRYYVEFEYDWDKMEFLEKKFKILRNSIHDDLKDYIRFLQHLE